MAPTVHSFLGRRDFAKNDITCNPEQSKGECIALIFTSIGCHLKDANLQSSAVYTWNQVH
jgi:hypothetical protein